MPKIREFAQSDWRLRVAIEVKHLMRALGGPHEYLGAPKDPFSGGFLGAPKYSRGPPRSLMRYLTSIVER